MADPAIGNTASGSEKQIHKFLRARTFVSPVLAGLALAVVMGILTQN